MPLIRCSVHVALLTFEFDIAGGEPAAANSHSNDSCIASVKSIAWLNPPLSSASRIRVIVRAICMSMGSMLLPESSVGLAELPRELALRTTTLVALAARRALLETWRTVSVQVLVQEDERRFMSDKKKKSYGLGLSRVQALAL